MLLYGDEIGRTQNGNNNAYCQDNEITWMSWNLDEKQIALLTFTRALITLRSEHPNLRRRKFYQDRSIRGSEVKDIVWYRPDGGEMAEEEWGLGWVRCLGVMLNGETIGDVDENGEPVIDDSFLLMLNCHHQPIVFKLPPSPKDKHWDVLIDTNDPGCEPGTRVHPAGAEIEIHPLSLVLVCDFGARSVTEI